MDNIIYLDMYRVHEFVNTEIIKDKHMYGPMIREADNRNGDWSAIVEKLSEEYVKKPYVPYVKFRRQYKGEIK